MGTIDYHLMELEIALSADDDRRAVPSVGDSDAVIVDIGCGIGQTLVALDCSHSKTCIGIDVDRGALTFGTRRVGHAVRFLCCDAATLAIASGVADLVFSRVALPYTDIPRVIREIRRVLKKEGRVWFALHGRAMACRALQKEIYALNLRRSLYATYVLLNGYVLKYLGFVIPYGRGKYGSWQDMATMRRLLIRQGFAITQCCEGTHMLIEGYVE